jgi:hypothetical protein
LQGEDEDAAKARITTRRQGRLAWIIHEW